MGNGVLRAWFGAIAFVLFIGFLFVEIVRGGATTATGASSTTTRTTGSSTELEVMGRDHGPALHPGLIPNYMISERRVPNGPDPIHNRKAGKSRQPPGRA